MLCQKALQEEDTSELSQMVAEIGKSEDGMLKTIFSISSDSFEKTLKQIYDLKCEPSGLEVAKIQKIQITKIKKVSSGILERSE